MYGILFAALAACLSFLVFIVKPIVDYYRDPKGLRKYPNMTLFSGVTNIPFMLLANTTFRSKTLRGLHSKNPVLRIGPNSLSFSDPRAIKDIYGHNTKCVKDRFYEVLSGTHFHLADVVDKSDHARKRKVLSSAYALKNLEGWEHKVADKTQRLIAAFDARCTAALGKKTQNPDPKDLTVDFRDWTNFFTVDAIADIGLSERLGLLDSGSDVVSARRMSGAMHEASFRDSLYSQQQAQRRTVYSYEWFSFLKKATNVVSPTFNKWWKHGNDWDDIVWQRTSNRLERYQKGDKLEDFFSSIMESKNGIPHGYEFGEIVAEVSIMMNAGSTTTAIAIANAMYCLLKNPEKYDKLRNEIDAVLDEDDIIAPYDKVRHLPYLRACLDEALRISPPTPFNLPRRTPPEGAVILDEMVAGNTSVSMSSYVVHHDEKLFPNPDMYLPERFLEENGGKDLHPFFIPFSTGARGCIGRNISYLEQTVLMSSLIHRYDFALPSPSWELKAWEGFNYILESMPVKVWRRVSKE